MVCLEPERQLFSNRKFQENVNRFEQTINRKDLEVMFDAVFYGSFQ